MIKKHTINKVLKLQILAKNATPASSIGPALGQHGVNIMKFCKEFNDRTKEHEDLIIPVVLTIFSDKSYSFILKTPPTSVLIKKILGLKLTKKPGAGSKLPGKEIIKTITYSQLEDIAKTKLSDLNAYNIESAIKIIAGSARSMGIDIKK